MAAISKFMFDTAFDADLGTPRPAGTPAASGRVLMTREEFDAAKAKAHADGLQEGESRATAAANARAASALQAVAAGLKDLIGSADRAHDERSRTAITIAATALRRTLPGLVAREGTAEIEALVRDCLGRLLEEPRVVVRVNDALLDALRDRVDRIAATAGFAGRVVLLADPALGLHDTRVEWADGGVERSPGTTQAEIDAAIDRHLSTPAATD